LDVPQLETQFHAELFGPYDPVLVLLDPVLVDSVVLRLAVVLLSASLVDTVLVDSIVLRLFAVLFGAVVVLVDENGLHAVESNDDFVPDPVRESLIVQSSQRERRM
jgi:hypothetical protein